VQGERLDATLEAMADLADLKSPYFAGHSRGVANLAAAAGRSWGLPESEVVVLRRAGLRPLLLKPTAGATGHPRTEAAGYLNSARLALTHG
jgi:hypothetical protein